MSKKLICSLLLIAICFTFAACGTGKVDTATTTTPEAQATTQQESTAPAEEVKLFPDGTVVSIMLPDEVSWPYSVNWYVKKTIEAETNVKLDIQPVEVSKYTDKFNLVVASGDMPDMIFQYNAKQANVYALQGAFIAAEDYYDKAPNFKKFVDENNELVKQYLAPDGKLYTFPGKGQGVGNRRHWIYRKDVFEKNGLAVPTTSDELYNVCKKLKELYPDSYPIASRKTGGIELMSPSWGAYDYEYYDFSNNVFKYGPIQPEYKAFLEFYNKLVKEELTPPDVLTISTQTWVDLMVQQKSFITMDYVTRMDSVGASGKEVNPEFQLAYMAPINKAAGYTAVSMGNFIVSSKSKKIEEAVKLIDWYYTDEAIELLSWGKEGETYVKIDGKRQFIMSDYAKEYGITASGWGLVIDESAMMSSFSQYAQQATVDMPQYEWRRNPAEYIQLTEAENEVQMTVGADLKKFAQEQEAQFVLGQKSFSEWDAYVKEIESKGLSKLLDMYTKAYERYK